MDDKAKLRESFEKAAAKNAPKPPYFKHGFAAFTVGGGICVFAQFLINTFQSFGMTYSEASATETIVVIFITGLLTALGLFDRIGRVAGAGTFVPITGFANSIVSSAIEFKAEGWIFGLGGNMFKVAGPVLVYGITSSWVVGIVYYLYLLVA
ncbi:MAG: SpoVA/SpoVAEb family sporulation membrane protein [Eubacteriaceae bacterium]|nr:SpoVA/SpoVAEb family sporulation membrane protein [Eubacteriaceae bacterium]